MLMSPAYLEAHRRHLGEYYALVLFAVIGMDLMAAARDFILLYVAFELMAISSYLLAAFFRYRARSNESALKYFLTGSFASAIMLYGISLVYGEAGATNYAAGRAGAGRTGRRPPACCFAVFLVAIGLAFKVSAAPFHMWTPDVYQGAPTPVTAFFSVGPKAAAFAAFIAAFVVAFPGTVKEWGIFFIVLSDRHHAGRQPLRPGADERQADAGLLVHRPRRLPARRPGSHGLERRTPTRPRDAGAISPPTRS